MRTKSRSLGLIASVAAVVVATAGLSVASPGHGSGHAYGRSKHAGTITHPPGNNGTVKVDGRPFDEGTNNEPHPGCTFAIDFFGYDQGDLHATYDLSLQPPSGRGELASGSVFIGGDPAGGGTDFDGTTGSIDLSSSLAASGATANANQGFHVFLTVHAEGSIGSDVKHKVFWVQCDAAGGAAPASRGRQAARLAPSGRGAPARPDLTAGRHDAGAPAYRATGRVEAARPAKAVTATPGFTG